MQGYLSPKRWTHSGSQSRNSTREDGSAKRVDRVYLSLCRRTSGSRMGGEREIDEDFGV